MDIYILYILMAGMLSIGTLNTHGSSMDRLTYVNKVMKSHDILMIQEHWLHTSQLHKLQSETQGVCLHGVSGMDDTSLVAGRPYGGVAIMWRKDIKWFVTPVDTKSKRICSIVVDLQCYKLLLIAVYMPVDDGVTNLQEYLDTLNQVSNVMNTVNADNIIIGGDFNTDLTRTNSRHTASLCNFIKDESLFPCVNLPLANIDYTFESKANNARSTVDHFLVSNNLIPRITKCDGIHEGDNLSDHVLVSLKMGTPSNMEYIEASNAKDTAKPMWHRASSDQVDMYKITLDSKLNDIKVPWEAIHCKNMHCNDNTHFQLTEKFHNDIISACLSASDSHIPHSKPAGRTHPGWNEYVEPFRDKAIFWHNIWKDNGSPRSGLIANIRRETRAKYHLAVKNLKRNSDNIRAEQMAKALLLNQTRDFWSEVKKVRTSNNNIPSQIDNTSGESNISELFAEKYCDILNSVSYHEEDMSNMLDKIDNRIDELCNENKCSHNHTITVEDIRKGTSKLKRGKQDGYMGHYSDHLINGTDSLTVQMSLLFNTMIMHGFTPEAMLLSTIVPIPQNARKSLNDSSNYRAIALSSSIGKLLDWILMQTFPAILTSSDLQFAYKEKSSTSQCTFVVNETINYYLEGRSNVHAILLDASKAFDRVHYVKLFNELLARKLCPLICRFLALQYSMQQCRVKWCSHISDAFSTTNGVKQGGVLSPVLFTIYMDCLLYKLRQSGVGCYIGDTFCGAFAYADDLILLAPTRSSMLTLISVCEEYSSEFHILFNASKSRHIFFNRGKCPRPDEFYLLGNAIPVADSEKHLGNTIGLDGFQQTIEACTNELYKNVNMLSAQFSGVTLDTKYQLFKTFCMSVYGSQLWDFENKQCEKFYTAWRKCIRKLFSLPYRTHSHLLPYIFNDLPVDVQLQLRFLNFVKSCYASTSPSVKICCQLAVNGSKSNMCNSLSHICNKLNICRYSTNFNITSLKQQVRDMVSSVDMQKAGLIHDLIGYSVGVDDEDLDNLIYDICTD
jgi:hypothetical protein